jgi:hypothetical protein
VSPVSEIFSLPANISGDRRVPWLTKILAKDVPPLILIGWTRQAWRLLDLPPPIRKNQVAGVFDVNSATCQTKIWGSEGPERPYKNYDFCTSKFRISKGPGFVFPISLD